MAQNNCLISTIKSDVYDGLFGVASHSPFKLSFVIGDRISSVSTFALANGIRGYTGKTRLRGLKTLILY
ncbi:MAG: hypothetical protein HWQ35_04970 [Nostoc sp. NMS1]|uniref:hypothetical protein n=1 Tax=unclassified Nostoc TaxID=2593658 RepID=UPI0025DEE0FF|nr:MULTISPECIES: hypothetical protein [unclassified Nostoc]MBN3905922.1 hypothetical protein [Nostoc sp. NMS1]MBN3993142.1 hypothetical protein [Nostoc sp. NMS2]